MLEIEQIKLAISSELPGKTAQYLMAPSDRTIRDFGVKPSELKNSAVLCLLYYKNDELHVLLTQRANYKGPHGGQISFPGGKFDALHDNNLQDTAERETLEEIQFSKDHYETLGQLSPLLIPVSKALVQPFVAFSKDISLAKVDGYEAVDLYEVSIKHLMDKDTVKWHKTEQLEYPYFDFEGKKIWGATAMMLSELLEIIKA